MKVLYRLLATGLHPAVPLYLRRRGGRGKEDLSRLAERMGHPSLPRPSGRLFWFHAASMGEALSVMPLIKKLLRRYPDAHVLLTTVTVTSARMAGTHLPEGAFHQFAPVDTPQAIRRFLAHWQPDAAFWVDSELWPTMLQMTHAAGCPQFLLNARISARSMKRWMLLRGMARAMLSTFTCVLAKSEDDAERFRLLGAPRVEMRGNLKFSAPPLEADAAVMDALRAGIGERPLWLAASTHPGEEAMVAEMHRRLGAQVPHLLTVIVPRHSHRGDEVTQALRAANLQVAQRSRQEGMTPRTDIYVADTMGELGVLYRIAGIVFIGGSLVPHGGQNPFEPARLGCAVLYGPHMENFTEFCQVLEAAQASIPVGSAAELEARVGGLLRDHGQKEALARRAMDVVEQNRQVIDRVWDAITPHLDARR